MTTFVDVTATWQQPSDDGAAAPEPASGFVTVTAIDGTGGDPIAVLDPDGDVIYRKAGLRLALIEAQYDANGNLTNPGDAGSVTVRLPASDDAGLNPSGFVYRFEAVIAGSTEIHEVEVLSSAAPSVNLADIAPAQSVESSSTFVLQGTFDTHGHDGTAGSGGTVAHADTGPTADDHHTKPTTPGEVGAAPASHLTDDPAHTFAEVDTSAQGADRILTTDGQGDPDSVGKDTYAHRYVADVKADYGAVGDGVTDDAAAFQAAVNAINAVDVDTRTIELPPGNYLIKSRIPPITADGGKIIGESSEQVTITLAADFDWSTVNANQSVLIGAGGSTERVQFQGFQIDGNSAPVTGGPYRLFSLFQASTFFVRDVDVVDFNGGASSRSAMFDSCQEGTCVGLRVNRGSAGCGEIKACNRITFVAGNFANGGAPNLTISNYSTKPCQQITFLGTQIDESTSGSAASTRFVDDGAGIQEITFLGANLLAGGVNAEAVEVGAGCSAKFVSCRIGEYDTSETGGLQVLAGGTASLEDCRLSSNGAGNFALDNEGTVYDLGNNTIPSLTGSGVTYSLQQTPKTVEAHTGTGGYTVVQDDDGRVKRVTQPHVPVDLPAGLHVGTEVELVPEAAGGIRLQPGAGATVRGAGPVGRYDPVECVVTEPDTWVAKADIPGLVAWFDASRIGQADASAVATWPDESGYGRDATQATAAKQPTYRTGVINGLPVVRFDGADDVLRTALFAVSSTGYWTAFAVADLLGGGSGNKPIVFQDGAGGGGVRLAQYLRYEATNGDLGTIAFNSASSAFNDSGGAVSAGFDVLSSLRTQTTVEAFVNGVGNGATATTGTPESREHALTLGADDDELLPANVDIAEVLIYNRDLQPAERRKVRDYLYSRYGLTGS